MASSLPNTSTEIFDRIEEAINASFNDLLLLLIRRKDELLDELNNAKLEYLEKERVRVEKLKDVESLIAQLNSTQISHENIQNIQKEFVDNAERELKSVQIPTLANVLEFDTDELAIESIKNEIQVFGNIRLPPYSEKVAPRLTFGPKGRKAGELRIPLGVDVNEHGIFVADFTNKRVQIFNMDGTFNAKFGWDKLNSPHGIAVKGDSFYVTDSALNVVHKYGFGPRVSIGNVNIRLTNQTYGNLDFPLGVCVSDDELFVADCNANRIVVFNLDLEYVKEIGDGKLNSPRDVKFHNDKLFVLDQSSPSHVHLFQLDGILINSFISLIGGTSSLFMCVDASENILISDGASSTIQIFNKHGVLQHVIVTKQPSGIAIAYDGDEIISARKYEKKHIAIY